MPPPLWLPPNCFNLQLTLESTPKLTRFVQPPPLSPCRGPTPCFSAHLQPDAPWVEGQHSARPQVDGHHAEGPLRQGAPRDQGPRRTLALGINLGAGNGNVLHVVDVLLPDVLQSSELVLCPLAVVKLVLNVKSSVAFCLEWSHCGSVNCCQRDRLCPGAPFPSNKFPYHAC